MYKKDGKWPMWIANVEDGWMQKIGTSKDDLISYLIRGHSSDNYVWGHTKKELKDELIKIGKYWNFHRWEIL